MNASTILLVALGVSLAVLAAGIVAWRRAERGSRNYDLALAVLAGASISAAFFFAQALLESSVRSSDADRAEAQDRRELDLFLGSNQKTPGIDLKARDLSSAYLPDHDFTLAQLAGADLSDSYLFRSKFDEASLGRTNFSNSQLSSAQFKRAFASATIFRGADLSSASFEGARLLEADLRDVCLLGTDLQGVVAQRADFSGTAVTFEKAWPQSRLICEAWQQSTLRLRTPLEPSQLRHGMGFVRARGLPTASLALADLSLARMRNVRLPGVDLRASLLGADLRGADLSQAVLSGNGALKMFGVVGQPIGRVEVADALNAALAVRNVVQQQAATPEEHDRYLDAATDAQRAWSKWLLATSGDSRSPPNVRRIFPDRQLKNWARRLGIKINLNSFVVSADLLGAKFDATTRWPPGFDPIAHGAKPVGRFARSAAKAAEANAFPQSPTTEFSWAARVLGRARVYSRPSKQGSVTAYLSPYDELTFNNRVLLVTDARWDRIESVPWVELLLSNGTHGWVREPRLRFEGRRKRVRVDVSGQRVEILDGGVVTQTFAASVQGAGLPIPKGVVAVRGRRITPLSRRGQIGPSVVYLTGTPRVVPGFGPNASYFAILGGPFRDAKGEVRPCYCVRLPDDGMRSVYSEILLGSPVEIS